MGHKRDANGNIVDSSNTDDQPVLGAVTAPNTANSSKPTRKFECTYEGCGKSYTRAEHLGRHQLNHNPKDIYSCDFPGCTRSFVRQDLCVRHRERHDASRSRTEGLSSEDEDVEPSTRRVGRPRLSSLNRSGSGVKVNHRRTVTAEDLPNATGDAQTQIAQAPTPLSRGTSNRHSIHSTSPGHFPTTRPQTGFGSNLNGLTIGMMNPRQTQPQTSMQNQDYLLPSLDFDESPASIRDEFTAWLFDDQFPNANGPFFNTSMNSFGTFGNDFMGLGNIPMFAEYDRSHDSLYDIGVEPATSTSDFEILTTDDIAWISSSKRSKLIDLMRNHFIDAENKDITTLRLEVFSGEEADAEDHVLSLRSMQLYLGSYWKHFHHQLPILHQPTFSADAANDLLVLAVVAIGASQLSSRHGRLKTTAASKFATFVAWHLRWQIFMHVDFRPPAKLWVFQTLLLLEVFEKLSSTRPMHERAHVHSATMINLMRRGTTLIGDDDAAGRTPGPTTPDEAWQRWINTESTRRAAFAAFVIDATHAVMFGHAAIMVVHELKLPLPCDDALWSATSAAEVGRVHASLHTHGIKPTTFIEGLKRTLTGKRVKTNSFGRTILMAGLLSIMWHLHQRDLQVSSLGASSSLGMPGIWREALSKSFDFWKRDFDESMSHTKNASLHWHQTTNSEDRDACTTAHILHHVSHITLHVEMLDFQIFAGAQRIFGRTITRTDYERAKHKMMEWVKMSSARNATFHAFQILKPIVMQTTSWLDFYHCRDDYLMNRGWAIYHALLVVWSYGYALDGILRSFPSHLTVLNAPPTYEMGWSGHIQSPPSENVIQACLEDARAYLSAVGSVNAPDELRMVQMGRNRVVGLLALFGQTFRDSRWELLQEGSKRLEKAVQILRDGD